jgi:hypothetical protein
MYNNQELILHCPTCNKFHLFKIKVDDCYHTKCTVTNTKHIVLIDGRSILLRANIDEVNHNHSQYSIYTYVAIININMALYSTDHYLVECK